jgi:hypothetical protein
MSRKQGLLIIFVIAVFLALGLHAIAGGSFDPVAVPALLGKSVGLFIFPGLLPCIVWAFMKFRRDRLRPVMAGWIALQIVFAIGNYLDMGRTAAGG